MKAVFMDGYGGPETLRLGEAARPVPAAGEVLLKIAAIGVNPADAKWRSGMFKDIAPLSFPHIPGYDVAGVVEDAGGSALAPGTRVATMLHAVRQGAYAEYVAAVTADAARIPEGLSFDIAAGVPTPGLTGVQMIEEHLDVQRGQTVLITGAVGMVGRFAMHAARRRGARIVAAVRAHQRDAARDMGADTSVVLDAEAWTGGTIDHVADTVGGASVAALCRHVPAGGKIYTAATTPIPPEHLATSPMFFAVHPDAARLADLLGAVAAGDIDLRIKAMKLAEAAEAQEMAISGGQAGKLVLRP